MALDATPRRRKAGKDEEATDVEWPPPELLRDDPTGQPDLLIVLSECLLERNKVCLHLDHHERSTGFVPPEQVDRSALAVDGIRHLGPDLPTAPAKEIRRLADQGRVAFVHEPIEVPAPPAELNEELGVECLSDRPEIRE